MWKQIMPNGDIRDETNAGFAAYIGRKRIAWGLDEAYCIATAITILKREPIKSRFVPTAAIVDCAQILTVAFVTHDASGMTVHRRNATNELDYQIMTDRVVS